MACRPPRASPVAIRTPLQITRSKLSALQREVEEIAVEKVDVAETVALLEPAGQLQRRARHVDADDRAAAHRQERTQLTGAAADLEHARSDGNLAVRARRRTRCATRARGDRRPTRIRRSWETGSPRRSAGPAAPTSSSVRRAGPPACGVRRRCPARSSSRPGPTIAEGVTALAAHVTSGAAAMERRRALAARAAQEPTHPLLAPRLLHVRRRGRDRRRSPAGRPRPQSSSARVPRLCSRPERRPSPARRVGRTPRSMCALARADRARSCRSPDASMSVRRKQAKASCGVHTIGSPRMLKDVFTSTGQPVSAMERAQQLAEARLGIRIRRSGCARTRRRGSRPASLERETFSAVEVRSACALVAWTARRSWAVGQGHDEQSCRDSDDRARSTRRSALPAPRARTAGSPRGT